MRRVLSPLLLVGLAMGATACSGGVTRGLATSDVEEQVAAGISDRREVEVEVDCPDDVEAETGGTFTCTATDEEGHSLDVSVVQEDDEGNVDWDVDMLNLPLIEEELSTEVTRSVGTAVVVECPRILVASEVGSTVDCRATDETGGAGVVRVTTKDEAGNVDWELNP